jgi:nucleoside-diphosphate-sugar epimerase
MKVLVIGAGNIGLSGVVPALRRFGHEVTIVTRRSLSIDGVTHICADYSASNFASTIRPLKFDALISMVTWDANGARVLLDSGARQIIFISTVCVMGGPLLKVPASEETEIAPITKYGINKRMAELILLEQQEVPVTIFRPASTVGPQFPLPRQLAVEQDMRWMRRIRSGKPIIVADDGQQRWHWCSADDAGIAVAAAVGRQKCYGQNYVLTRREPITWLDYHLKVGEVLGHSPEFVFVPSDVIIASGLSSGLLREQSQWDQHYDVSKLIRDFPEFQPATSFSAMVERCIEYMDARNMLIDDSQEREEDELIMSWRVAQAL